MKKVLPIPFTHFFAAGFFKTRAVLLLLPALMVFLGFLGLLLEASPVDPFLFLPLMPRPNLDLSDKGCFRKPSASSSAKASFSASKEIREDMDFSMDVNNQAMYLSAPSQDRNHQEQGMPAQLFSIPIKILKTFEGALFVFPRARGILGTTDQKLIKSICFYSSLFADDFRKNLETQHPRSPGN